MSSRMDERRKEFRGAEGESFPDYQTLNRDVLRPLEHDLARRLLALKTLPSTELAIWRALERKEVAPEGADGSKPGFDVAALCQTVEIAPLPEVIVDFGFDDGDRMPFVSLAAYLEHIYHPMDDLLVFDDSLTWLIHIWHGDGRVGFIRA